MKKYFVILVITNCFFGLFAYGQVSTDSLQFLRLVKQGAEIYNRKSYDSAFIIYKTAYEFAIKNKMNDYYTLSQSLLFMGDCKYAKKEYAEAHQYYYAALKNARQYKHHSEIKNKAFRMLNSVHTNIQKNDLLFDYPLPSIFTEQQVYFDIDSVLYQKGDSAVISINAGLYDGIIKDKNQGASIFIIPKERENGDREYIGSVELITISNNKSIAIVRLRKTIPIELIWQVRLIANVSDNVMESGISNIFLTNFNWKGNNNLIDLYNRRFLYYYADEDYGKDLMAVFKNEILEVVNKFGSDTLQSTSPLAQKIKDGIFTGMNTILALQESNGSTINYFLSFMLDFEESYIGRKYLFSDIYATWALYNAQLSKKSIKEFILGDEESSDEMKDRAGRMKRQVEEHNLTDKWVDEGLELVDKNFWSSLLSQSRLLYHYGAATGRADCIAWSNFFDAVRLINYGNTIKSDSFLTAAHLNFKAAGSNEGIQWINSVRSAVMDSNKVKLNVQRQHTLSYDVYPSPNQRYFATAGKDFSIKIWDINLGKQIYTIDGHSDEVIKLAYNPGGRYLASLSDDKTIKVWNTFTYGLMNSFSPNTEQNAIKFSPDGKYLVSTGIDSTVNFWDPFSGKLFKSFRAPGGFARDLIFDPSYSERLYLLCTDSAVYSYRLDSNLISREIKSNMPIINFFFSKNGKYGCFYKTDSTFFIFDKSKGIIEYQDKVFVWKMAGSRYFSDGAFSPDEKYFLFCRSDSTTVIVNLSQRKSVPFYSLPVSQYVFNSDGTSYIKHHFSNPSIVDFSDFNFDKTYKTYYSGRKSEESKDLYFSLKEKVFSGQSAPIMDIKFSKDDKSLYYLTWQTNKLDFVNGKSTILYPEIHWMSGVHDYPENEEIVVFKKFNKNDTLNLYNVAEKKIVASLFFPNNEEINSFAFYDNDQYCILSGANESLISWNIQQKKIEFHVQGISQKPLKIHSTKIQPGTRKIIVYGSKGKPLIIDADNGKLLDSINISNVDRIAFTSDKIFFTSDSGRLYQVDTLSYVVKQVHTIKSTKNYLTEIKTSANGKYLFVLDDPHYYILTTENLQIISQFSISGKNNTSFIVSHNDSTSIIGSMSGELNFYTTFSGKPIGKIYFPSPDEAILIDSNGYYMASKKALQSVVFSQGYKYYNYDQFDLNLNQPHKVLDAFGIADSLTIRAYENAYYKRIKRNGFKETSILQTNLPSLIVLNRSLIRPTTNKNSFSIRAECFDMKNKLSTLKVFVNDVPLTDSTGEWSTLDTSYKIFNITIPLSNGINKVKIYCVNNLGLSSYKESFEIYCTAKNQKQTTWFIGLGTSLYADPVNNLSYSVKDIRDLANGFKKIYPDINIDTLMNKQVNLKNIQSLKQRMKKIKVNDKVILAVTGHGLLSDSLDFYYATYDVDFNKPELKGLKYEELENMLNNTAARQKLLLIDACHSGMLDKESVLKAKSEFVDSTSTTAVVKIKGSKGIDLGVSPKLDETNNFNLMQTLFADFSNENGIVVISAAGGLEYAFESKEWRNGVFTYCVLMGLEKKEADSRLEGGNEDGKVSVQELMRYVSNKVPELTKGQQKPTSRRENLDFDWIIK